MRYGIRCTLSPSDPMSAPHLIGPGWVDHYWYATAAERDVRILNASPGSRLRVFPFADPEHELRNS